MQIPNNERQDVVTAVLNHVTEVLWHFFSVNESGLDDEEAIDQFVVYLWGIAAASMGAVGLDVVGKNKDDRYVLSFSPVDDVVGFIESQMED